MLRNIKARLAQIGKTQVELIMEIHRRGFPNLAPARFSQIIKGTYALGSAPQILDMADDILKEWEAKNEKAKYACQ